MIVPINDKWRFRTDTYAWLLQRLFIHGEDSSTPGRREWRKDSFHGSLEAAANHCINKDLILDIGGTSWDDLLIEMWQIRKEVTEACKGVPRADSLEWHEELKT